MFWNDVVRRLETEIPPFVIDAWVRPLVAEANGDRIRLLCPSALHRDRVRDRFLRRIVKLAEDETGKPVEIKLDLAASTPAERISIAPAERPSIDPASPAAANRTFRPAKRGGTGRVLCVITRDGIECFFNSIACECRSNT